VISISNIAWDVSFDDEVSDILSSYGVSYIDIAHSKYFSNPEVVSDEQIEAVTSYWSSKGIKPLGMQSLLYGTSGLNVFGDTDVQNRMLEHLSDICRIGNKLDARKLVFGSPRNRDRSDIQIINCWTLHFLFFTSSVKLHQNIM